MLKLIVYKAKERKKKRLYTGYLWIPNSLWVDFTTEWELMYKIRKEFGIGYYRIASPGTRTRRGFRTLCKCYIFDNGWIREGGTVGSLKPISPVNQFHLF
jgi:hypothetical protein